MTKINKPLLGHISAMFSLVEYLTVGNLLSFLAEE